MTNTQVELAQEIGSFMKASRDGGDKARSLDVKRALMSWRECAQDAWCEVLCRRGAVQARCCVQPVDRVAAACVNGAPAATGVQVWVLKQGWLAKRGSGRVSSSHWQRRWFVLQSDGTFYHLSSRNGEERKAVINLCISTIKTDAKDKERAAFSLVSPSHTYHLQAEDDTDRQAWIDAIQARAAQRLHLACTFASMPGTCRVLLANMTPLMVRIL
jgi:PH domain